MLSLVTATHSFPFTPFIHLRSPKVKKLLLRDATSWMEDGKAAVEGKAAVVLQRGLTGLAARKAARKQAHRHDDGSGSQGFIRVIVRVRPLGEGRGTSCQLVNVDARRHCITVTGRQSEPQRFDFERVVSETEDNESLERTVGTPLVEQVVQGYNGTLFAYGQTGSGKSYTIGEVARLGTEHEGVSHRMVRALFAELAQMHCKSYKVTLQFVQVYMESVHDLLAEQRPREGAQLQPLREDKLHGVYVDGAKSVPTPTAASCLETIGLASANLAIASTYVNRGANSEPSHSLTSC